MGGGLRLNYRYILFQMTLLNVFLRNTDLISYNCLERNSTPHTTIPGYL